jgi:hypothetical protein
MQDRSARRSTAPLTLLLLLLLLAPARSFGIDPSTPVKSPRPDQTTKEEPTVSPALPETAATYVFEDDVHRIEFTREGMILRFKVDGSSAALWIDEIRRAEGPRIWSREQPSLDFSLDEDTVTYRRTRSVRETYFVDRTGLHQVWNLDGETLRGSGDLVVIGEILTPLQVDLVDGRIHLSKGANWVDSFCTFLARDGRGNELEIVPALEGKRIRLTVPGDWISRTGPGTPAGG